MAKSIWKGAKMTQRIKLHEPENYDLYIQCGSGWQGIIDQLTFSLEQLDPDFEIKAIKEKFGSLRYYIDFHKSDNVVEECIYTLLDKAQHEASNTCECCGTKKGVSTKATSWNWLSTLCTTCRAILEEERKNGIA